MNISNNQPEQEKFMLRIWIIASHFTSCKVNSSYCEYKVVNHTKIEKHFFSERKFNSSKWYFPTLYPYSIIFYILLFYCILLYSIFYYSIIKKILFIPKITLQNAKNASQFLKKRFCLWQGESLAMLGIFIVKWISNYISNADAYLKKCVIHLQAF